MVKLSQECKNLADECRGREVALGIALLALGLLENDGLFAVNLILYILILIWGITLQVKTL